MNVKMVTLAPIARVSTITAIIVKLGRRSSTRTPYRIS